MTSHQAARQIIGTGSTINTFGYILKELLDAANLDLDYDRLVINIPNFTSPDFANEMARFKMLADNCKNFQKASALKLFAKIDDRCELNENTLDEIVRNFRGNKPTVLLTCAGHQNIGKSTLLNCMMQFAFQSSRVKNFFKAESSQIDVTVASDVASYPLPCVIDENQMMLVDLEGLQSMSVEKEAAKILQANLVSSVLRISSVVCIIVRNEIEKIEFAKELVKKISFLNKEFNFKMERIYVLYQDMAIDADLNPSIVKNIADWNRDYFYGEEVIILKNKPNFISEDKAACESFLSDLMNDCCRYPKKNAGNIPLSIEQIFFEIALVCMQTTSDLSIIKLSPEEQRESEIRIRNKLEKLKKIASQIKSLDGQKSLKICFNEELKAVVDECRRELHDRNPHFIMYIQLQLEIKAAALRVSFSEIDYMYQTISTKQTTELIDQVRGQMIVISNDCTSPDKFTSSVDVLKAKFVKVSERFPTSASKVQILVKALECYKKCIVDQLSSSVSTWGSVVKGTVCSFKIFWLGALVAGVASVVFPPAEYIYLMCWGGGFGSGLVGFAAQSIGISVVSNQQEKWRQAVNYAQNLGSDQRAIASETNAAVVLNNAILFSAISLKVKGMGISSFLNQLLDDLNPIAGSKSSAFNEQDSFQMRGSTYTMKKEGQRDLRIQILFTYVLLEKNPLEREDKLEQAAGSLLSEASIGCFIVGAHEQTCGYYDRVLNYYDSAVRKYQSLAIYRTSSEEIEAQRLYGMLTSKQKASYILPFLEIDGERNLEMLYHLLNTTVEIPLSTCSQIIGKAAELSGQEQSRYQEIIKSGRSLLL